MNLIKKLIWKINPFADIHDKLMELDKQAEENEEKAKRNIIKWDEDPFRIPIDPLDELTKFVEELYNGYNFVKTFELKLKDYKTDNDVSEISAADITLIFITYLKECQAENNRKHIEMMMGRFHD